MPVRLSIRTYPQPVVTANGGGASALSTVASAVKAVSNATSPKPTPAPDYFVSSPFSNPVVSATVAVAQTLIIHPPTTMMNTVEKHSKEIVRVFELLKKREIDPKIELLGASRNWVFVHKDLPACVFKVPVLQNKSNQIGFQHRYKNSVNAKQACDKEHLDFLYVPYAKGVVLRFNGTMEGDDLDQPKKLEPEKDHYFILEEAVTDTYYDYDDAEQEYHRLAKDPKTSKRLEEYFKQLTQFTCITKISDWKYSNAPPRKNGSGIVVADCEFALPNARLGLIHIVNKLAFCPEHFQAILETAKVHFKDGSLDFLIAAIAARKKALGL